MKDRISITFLGGAEEIGASCQVIDIGETRVVVDCGQRLNAPKGEALPDLSYLEKGPPVSAVLVTHAHTDHIGALPAIDPYLPKGCPILATEATLELSRVMLHDTRRIMEKYRQDAGEMPLFAPGLVSTAIDRMKSVAWGRAMRLGDAGVKATWFPSGHLLGAAMIEIAGPTTSVLVSGDVSVGDQYAVPGAFAPSIRPDVLVLESTYGDRMHAHRPTQYDRIIERVRQCYETGGSILFPTFALGRAQEILLLLGHAMRRGKLSPNLPVYADGLVRPISEVYDQFPDELAPEARRLWESGLNPVFPRDLPVRPVVSNGQRQRIAQEGRCVVVASSGMLHGGASQFYATQWIGSPRNLILITGYQDEESPGQALLDLAETVEDRRYFPLGGVWTEVGCAVEACPLSAHADGGELTALASKFKSKLVLLVHGDGSAREGLARQLMRAGISDVGIPVNGETVDFEPGWSRRPVTRTSPLQEWPPWDPTQSRALNLAEIHYWLCGLSPPVPWITLEELVEIWKQPQTVTAADRRVVREAIYGSDQSYFIPDRRRPFILRVTARDRIVPEGVVTPTTPVERARASLRGMFPEETGLVRTGFYPEERVAELTFRFPRAAERHLAQRLQEWSRQSGWAIRLVEGTSDDDLLRALHERLAPEHEAETRIDHEHSLIEVRFDADPAISEATRERFHRQTGYELFVNVEPEGARSTSNSSTIG
ncbi:Ribonuclease [Planctomycetes bacterium Pan216]|uniref:Ribonuclease n=1 Tax=Kolteria novifilia TaxID=2527975 RepID=A0A518AYF6_9BACT|nr:Ribonuclease [Planctomycetes bacterium Pan216]